MKAQRPEDLPALFLEALNSGDVDSVVSLYEAEGVVAADANHPVIGQAAIRSMVAGFLAQNPKFTFHGSEVVQTTDVALIRSRWTISSTDSLGSTTEIVVAPTLVARRQPDGYWLVVIDRPLAGDESAA